MIFHSYFYFTFLSFVSNILLFLFAFCLHMFVSYFEIRFQSNTFLVYLSLNVCICVCVKVINYDLSWCMYVWAHCFGPCVCVFVKDPFYGILCVSFYYCLTKHTFCLKFCLVYPFNMYVYILYYVPFCSTLNIKTIYFTLLQNLCPFVLPKELLHLFMEIRSSHKNNFIKK